MTALAQVARVGTGRDSAGSYAGGTKPETAGTCASAAELYAEYVAARDEWRSGERWMQSRVRTLYVRFFRQSCAEGRPPDSLDRWIEDEELRFFSQVLQGSDGHAFWPSSPKKFRTNAGHGILPRRWWWHHLHGACGRGVVQPMCGERHCIHPHHQQFVEWKVYKQRYTDEQVLGAIQTVALRLGRTPSQEEYDAAGVKPVRQIAVMRFGRWSDAVTAAGLKPNPVGVNVARGNKWSDSDLISALQSTAHELGHAPSGRWWETNMHAPSEHTIARRFGGWRKALAAAGLAA